MEAELSPEAAIRSGHNTAHTAVVCVSASHARNTAVFSPALLSSPCFPLPSLCLRRARYLATAGIGRTITPTLLPLIGAMDIALGVAVVLYPHPLLLAWAVVWALAAAAMRPLSGESAWTAVEMSGNWLPALALLWDTTASEGTTYQWMLTTVVLLMLLVAATLLLRQTGLLADRPRTGR